jgi:hypothetical protein
MPHTSIVALLLTVTSAAYAQSPIPVREVGNPEAVSADTVGYLYGVRELSDGRVLANDAAGRRLILFDATLARATIIADSTTATRVLYGKRPTGIIPYAGDSTLLIDVTSRTFLVVDPDGKVPRVMSPPRANDVPFLWNPAVGSPRFDPKGNLVYRTFIMPAFHLPEPGKPFTPPVMPDSAPLLRGDFDRRSADTIAWIGIPRTKITTTSGANGSITLRALITPLAFVDDWTMLTDGTIAILRGRDYHIDWVHPDGTRWSSPKMPFDWRRLSDDDKAAIVDSTRRALEKNPNAMPTAMGGGAGARMDAGMGGHSMTITPVQAGDGGGGPAPRPSAAATPAMGAADVVPPSELPDYVPPVLRSGLMKADADGNVWILPSTSAQSGAGLLYDVVNRKGELFQRVRLPVGRALEGFGANGTIYLTSHGSGGARLERARLE